MANNPISILESMISRADKLHSELKQVYEKDLLAKEVSADALNITHEIIEKCSNVMDQSMTLAFEIFIKGKIDSQPKRGGYFPVARDEGSYRSSLGQWNAKNLEEICPKLERDLRSLQPFSNPDNAIFIRIRELANKKHTGLVPQKRFEQKRVNVARQGVGSVNWGSGVTFGRGVSVMGVPINPSTQMPAHTQGIDVSIERWVSFNFEGGGENALDFCRLAIAAARRVVSTLFG